MPGPELAMPSAETIRAARDGDPEALDEVVSRSLRLLYNIVGRALNGHPDVDDVVQETVLAVLRSIGTLRDPESFRSWLVAVAVRQIRDQRRSVRRSMDRFAALEETAGTVVEPDFAALTALRLGLSGQRREIAEATRWLDDDDRELLALWWLEAGGSLERSDLVGALGLPAAHVAVRVQRMKERLDTGRCIVRVLANPPDCEGFAVLRAGWDAVPSPLWRKRFARHIRDCPLCSTSGSDLIAAERLLVGLGLVPVPVVLVQLAHQAVRLPSTHAIHPPSGQHSLGAPAAARSIGPGLKAAIAVPLVGGAVAGMAGLAWLGHGQATPAAHVTGMAPPVKVAAPQPAVASTAPSVVPPAPKRHRPKPVAAPCRKGVSTWNFAAADRSLAASTACWFYNWGPSPAGISSPSGVEYVSMVWGAKSADPSTLATVKAHSRTVLGFNEPDMSSQANMSVDQALALWPSVTGTGLRVGSPAVAYGAATPGGWLDRFMTGAAQNHYRVDFITLHWYGADFVTADAVAQLKSYLQAVYDRYHKPIWLTEYALMRFGPTTYPSQQEQAGFVRASTAMLDGLPYLERYAWFALPATPGSGTGLFTTSGTPTVVGTAFQAAR